MTDWTELKRLAEAAQKSQARLAYLRAVSKTPPLLEWIAEREALLACIAELKMQNAENLACLLGAGRAGQLGRRGRDERADATGDAR